VQYNAQGLEVDAQGVPVIAQRLAGLNAAQLQTQQDVLGLRAPAAFTPSSFDAGQVTAERIAAERVAAERAAGASMGTAQTGYNPQLAQYQLAAPEQFGNAQAQQYMSPYIQNVMDMQKAAAVQDAKKAQLAQNLGSAKQGTYGGARQLLATTERERALAQQMGGIEATGLQSAYENAQSQFERDRAAGLNTGQANLQALLGTQQLGTQTGLQTALANLSSEQQANVQNLAAELQTQGLNAQQALQAALANQSTALSAAQSNQSTGLQAALANQQAALEAQRMGESSRQFASTTGNSQVYADLARLQAQQSVGTQRQALTQAGLDTAYNDWLAQQNAPKENLSFYGNLINGLPMGTNTTTTASAPSPSPWAQYAGLAAAGLGTYNAMKP